MSNPTTQTTPTFNQSQEPPIKIDWLDEQTPVVSSVDVALHFGKKHKNILREIEGLRGNLPQSFFELNFKLKAIETPTGFGTRQRRRVYFVYAGSC